MSTIKKETRESIRESIAALKKMRVEVFNEENTEWKTGEYSLFLGQEPALYDSINVRYPEIFKMYKTQKAGDWAEDEINLKHSRIDMETCPFAIKDTMLENIAYQWETDSVAARSVIPLFAPFITNSEFWAYLVRVGDNENLHALTYSEIVRLCIPDPAEIFNRIMKNKHINARLAPIIECFKKLKIAGAEYTLGLINDEEAYPIVMNALVALYCMERIQFVVSFASTFATVEADNGYFQGIGKLVQKIMQDERFIHAEGGKLALQIEFATERGKKYLQDNLGFIKNLIDTVVQNEYAFSKHLCSDGRSVPGYTEAKMNDWADYNAVDVYETFGLTSPRTFKETPLKFMDFWLDLDKTQNAQQEGDGNQYLLNIIIDDLGDDIIEDTNFNFGYGVK